MTWRGLPTRHRASLGILLRLALAAGAVMPLATLYRETLVEAWLPAYRAVFAWVADEFRLVNLAIDHEGADRVLRATVTWKRIVVLGGHVIYPDPRGTANASTLIAHGLQGPVVALIAACAWPARRLHEFAWRVMLLGPLLTVLVLADLPCVLAAELRELPLDALAPGAVSVLVIWKDFLQGGGRHALGLAAAVAVVQGAGWLGLYWNPLRRAPPKTGTTPCTDAGTLPVDQVSG